MRTRRQKISEDRQSTSRRDSRSSSLVNGGELIPIDLIIEILSRLPVKSIARSRCVSKLWGSTIGSPEFTDLVLTRSVTTRPQLLFACEKDGAVFFYSSPQPQNPDPIITVSYHMSFPLNNDSIDSTKIHLPVHGLICLKNIRKLKGRKETVMVICNPSTGQSLTLPRVKTRRVDVRSYFGYDPIHKQFKVLCMTISNRLSEEHQILTLGNGKLLWRMIQCSVPHYPLSGGGICIDGVLYYRAEAKGFEEGEVRIACFDIRSEKFKIIEDGDKDMGGKLVNYKGKLATLRTNNCGGSLFLDIKSFELCVLEDAEKHEWSTRTYVLPPSYSTDFVPRARMHIIGVTKTGEIVFTPSNPYYLLYYNLERNTIVKVEIQGIDVSHRREIHTFIDHVEDVKLGGVFET